MAADRVRASYDPYRHHALATLHGQDPGVAGIVYGALCWWQLGYPDTARARCEEALALGRAWPHPHTLMQAFALAAWTHVLLRDWPAVQRHAEESIALAQAHSSAMWRHFAGIMLGRARAALGARRARRLRRRPRLSPHRDRRLARHGRRPDHHQPPDDAR